MNRRITRAILGVTALALIAFALPLAYAVNRLYRDEEIVRLERIATGATGNLSTDALKSQDPVELPATGDQTRLAIYTPLGKKISGNGPRTDPRVEAARGGQVADGSVAGELVVAVPVNRDETVIAIVRAAVPNHVVAARALRAWLLMLGIGLAVLAAATVLATIEARRLTRPVDRLTAAATRLGEGDFTVTVVPSGVVELDEAGRAVEATAHRLGDLVTRERAFSADASHQLRTPVTALRLRLETATTTADPAQADVFDQALEDVSRLEATIDGLLELARDTQPDDETIALEPVLDDVITQWHGPLAAAGRPLRLDTDPELRPVRIREPALRQILTVLLSNAAVHGAGVVTVRARQVPGGVAVDVEDEGHLPDGDPERLFERRSPDAVGTGIGLALGRSIAEGDGARLLARRGGTTRFTLLATTT